MPINRIKLDPGGSQKERWVANSIQKKMEKLGLSKFETRFDCEDRQRLMLLRFHNHYSDNASWDGLSDCTLTICGRPGQCVEACHFATMRRRADVIETGLSIIEDSPGPYFFVTIVHPAWQAPVGQLSTIKHRAAMQWHYRRLSELKAELPSLLAVGGFEVALNKEEDGTQHWAGHLHLLVAGATDPQLRKAYRLQSRWRELIPDDKYLRVEPPERLPNALGYSVKRLIEQRIAFNDERNDRQNRRYRPPPAKLWAELDRWLLSIPIGGLTVLFNCSRRGLKLFQRG